MDVLRANHKSYLPWGRTTQLNALLILIYNPPSRIFQTTPYVAVIPEELKYQRSLCRHKVNNCTLLYFIWTLLSLFNYFKLHQYTITLVNVKHDVHIEWILRRVVVVSIVDIWV